MSEKVEMIAPIVTPYTDEKLGTPDNMIDDDNCCSVEEQFVECASLEEGVSGCKPIDTLYDNTSEDRINAPRSARRDVPIAGMTPNHEGVNNPAPIGIGDYEYPHRSY